VGDEVITSTAGYVSRAMLARYSHVRMEAKRSALDEIVARQCAADEKHQQEVGRQQLGAVASPSSSGSVRFRARGRQSGRRLKEGAAPTAGVKKEAGGPRSNLHG
jgi:hypothetical protein